MPVKRNTIAEQLKIASIRIDNSLANNDVKTEVAKKGYTEEKLLEGKEIIKKADAAVKVRISLDGAAQDATAVEKQRKNNAHNAYQGFAKIARAKYKPGSPELVTLGLVGAERVSTAEFIKAGYVLFDNAKSDAAIAAAVATNGYTAEVLTAERAKIEAYEKANKDQTSAIGDAQNATEEQTKALKAMNDWISEFTKIARVALNGKKKLLEKIGIKARTTKTKAQRGASKKAAATRAAKKAVKK